MAILKKPLRLLECMVPYALLPIASDLFDNRFPAFYTQSLIPFFINEACAFLPAFVLAFLEPEMPNRVTVLWAFLSSSAYFASYSWSLFHVRQAEPDTLWPIGIVVATAFALIPLWIGIVVGKDKGASKRR